MKGAVSHGTSAGARLQGAKDHDPSGGSHELILPFLVAAGHAAPRVVVDKPAIDFGEVPQGQKIAHAFILKNAGDVDLTIHVKPC